MAAAAAFACTPGELLDENSATVRFERTGDAAFEIIHNPLTSTLSLSPPAGGVVEMVLTQSDPFVELRLQLDAALHGSGDTVTVPADGVSMDVELTEASFSTGAAGATGEVDIVLLVVDGGVAEANIGFLVTLPASVGADEMVVDGVVDARSE